MKFIDYALKENTNYKVFKKMINDYCKNNEIKIKFKNNFKVLGKSNPSKKTIEIRNFKNNNQIQLYTQVFLHELFHLKFSDLSSIFIHTFLSKNKFYVILSKSEIYEYSKKEFTEIMDIFNGIEDAMVDLKIQKNNIKNRIFIEKFIEYNFKKTIDYIDEKNRINVLSYMIKLYLFDKKEYKKFIDKFKNTKKIKISKIINYLNKYDIENSDSFSNFKFALKIYNKIFNKNNKINITEKPTE